MAGERKFGLMAVFDDLRDFVRGLGKAVNATRNGSLPEFLKSTNVEPICLIEKNLAYQDFAEDIVSTALDLTALMYLQVFSRLMTVDIDAVRVTRMLEKLATERDVLGSMAAVESDSIDILSLGLEADTDDLTNPKGMETQSKLYAPITDNNQLSVGKLLACTVTNGKEKLEIPVNVRLRTKEIQPALVKDIFEANYADLNIARRIKLWGLMEMTFLEAITASDVVAKQERIRMADKDGLIQSHFMNAAKDAGYSAITGEVPINRASGILIISDDTAAMISRTTRLRLTRYQDREKFFEGTAAMMIIVVDAANEVADFYFRGFKDGSTETFRKLQRSGGKGGQDLTPVIKDMLSGSVPTL